MPTVLRLPGLRIVIYTHDHLPPHVHAQGPGGAAIFLLNCPDGPPTLREDQGLGLRECKRIGKELAAHAAALCAQWGEIHGDH
jgi:hypothetical protein